ncbi:tetratricopeptide repeat protein, partial [Bradyrhizobium sp.]|uniref:tetratricopeptide repeat protein n=1 Tax=Bradyrhizobium sp. TaxID=376 RepID=UPI003C426544
MSRHEPEPAANRTGADPGPAAPSTPDALRETGLLHLQAGRLLDAQRFCEQALAIDAGHPDSLQLMGLLSLHTGHYDHAVEWLARAIRQNPK